MTFTESDLDVILDNETKIISCDIQWQADEDHSPAVEFLVPINSDLGYQLKIRGSYNSKCKTFGFAMLLGGHGRIYGLDIGTDHRNPKQKERIGKIHKHKWSNIYKDKQAYVPNDITKGVCDVVKIWKEFCIEAKIRHEGELQLPR